MGPPKNRAGVRENILPEPLIQMFKEHKVRQRRHQLEAGCEWVGAVDAEGKSWDLVFTDRRGRLVRPNDDWRAWRAFTSKHGLEGMRVHDARHTAATLLLSMGVAPQVTWIFLAGRPLRCSGDTNTCSTICGQMQLRRSQQPFLDKGVRNGVQLPLA